MLFYVYLAITLLVLVLVVREFIKAESLQMKICACFCIIPLALRVLMLK